MPKTRPSMRFWVLAVSCVLIYQQVESLRVIIQVNEESMQQYEEHLTSKRQVRPSMSSCDDSIEVARHTALTGHLQQLDQRLDDRVKFWHSDHAQENLNTIETMMSVDLRFEDQLERSLSLRTVFDVLRSSSCPVYFIGGTVRDQFLSAQPKDIDIQVDCDFQDFYEACKEEWTENNCHSLNFAGRMVGHIGHTVEEINSVVDVGSTDLVFQEVWKLEYTVNSMLYDTNGMNDKVHIIIDLTGKGRDDICNEPSGLIRIPSDESDWGMWRNYNSDMIIYRFWKLRSKKLQAASSATQDYIVSKAKMIISTDHGEFSSFYCKTVFEGKLASTSTKSSCIVSNVMKCSSNTVQTYNNVFREDFGAYWNDRIKPILPHCSASGSKPLSNSITIMALSLAVALVKYS